MNLQKADKIIELELEQHTEKKAYLQILGRPKIISTKMESQSASTTTYINIQQKNAKNQRRNETQGSAINATRQGTLPKTTG